MQTRPQPWSLWEVLGASLSLSLVLSLATACQMLSGGRSIDALEGVQVESSETLSFPGWANTLTYFQGGRSLVIGGCQASRSGEDNVCVSGLIQVLTLKGAAAPTTMTLPRPVTALAALPDGNKWVAGDTEGRLIVSTTKSVPRPFHQKGKITALAFSPDGKWVASGSLDPYFPLGLMDMKTGGVVKVKARFEPVTALSFSPDGKTLAVGMTQGGVVLWNFTSSDAIKLVAGSLANSAVTSATFSPNGELLAYGRQDGRVVIVDHHSGQPTAEYKGSAAVNTLAFSPDGQFLALGQDNGKVLLLDSQNAVQVWGKRHILPISNLAFSPDGASLAVTAQRGIFLYYLGGGSSKPGSASRVAESSGGARMRATVPPTSNLSSSGRFVRVIQIAQDEYIWLMPFDRVMASALRSMLKVVPGAAVEPVGVVPVERFVLRADGRFLDIDLGALRQVKGREGLRKMVQTYESAQRFLLASSPAAAASLEEAAIQGALAELGPGLRLVPWPDETPTGQASGNSSAFVPAKLSGQGPGVEQTRVANRVTYFKLTKFSKLTAERVQQWFAGKSELQRQAGAAVLDLRDNQGGDLESAVATAKGLVPPGHLIAGIIVRKNGERIEFRSDNSRRQPRALVVLVNERTAGTAELLACAIRASGAGVLVGSQTAGSDEVYTVFRLPGGDGLRVSTGRFFCPDERSIRWTGQSVDVEVDKTAMTGAAPIGASQPSFIHYPRNPNPLAINFLGIEDQQLRIAADIALCISNNYSGTQVVQKGTGQDNDSVSLSSVCR